MKRENGEWRHSCHYQIELTRYNAMIQNRMKRIQFTFTNLLNIKSGNLQHLW